MLWDIYRHVILLVNPPSAHFLPRGTQKKTLQSFHVAFQVLAACKNCQICRSDKRKGTPNHHWSTTTLPSEEKLPFKFQSSSIAHLDIRPVQIEPLLVCNYDKLSVKQRPGNMVSCKSETSRFMAQGELGTTFLVTETEYTAFSKNVGSAARGLKQ